jgi:hypothetical protein
MARPLYTVHVWQSGRLLGTHSIFEDKRPSVDTEPVNGVNGDPVLCVWTEKENFEYYGDIAWRITHHAEAEEN